MGLAIATNEIAPQEVPISDILKVLQSEIGALAETAEQLQEMTSKLIQAGGGQLSGALIAEAQSLDVLHQRLGALATFLNFLVPGVPKQWVVDPRSATSMLKLASLAGRILAVAQQDAATGIGPGDIDLF